MVGELGIWFIVAQVIVIVGLVLVLLWLGRTLKSLKKEKRIAQFALVGIEEHEKAIFETIEIWVVGLIRRLGQLCRRSVFLSSYADRYEKHISYEAKENISVMDIVVLKFLIGLLLVILNIVTIAFQYLSFSLVGLLVTFLIGFFSVDIVLAIVFARKRQRVEEDLLKAIIMMNNAFKSGRNIMQAIDIVRCELDGPIKDEFAKIYMDITYGLSLEVVFDRFYDRVQLQDAKYIASSLTLLNKTGGNIVKVFASIEKNFYNKKKLREELRSMTASSNLVFKILVFMPVVFALVIFALNPSYFTPLFTTGIGLLLTLLMVGIFVLYIVVIKKVLKVNLM